MGQGSLWNSPAYRDRHEKEVNVKIDKENNTAVLTADEMKMVIRHLQEFEKLTDHFQKLEATHSLGREWQHPWNELKSFLEAEELKGSERGPLEDAGESGKGEADGYYCCSVYLNGTLIKRVTYKTWFAWAWTKCVAQTVLGNNCTVTPGAC
jgi:hypothetical protein